MLRLKAWGWEIAAFDPAHPVTRYRQHAIEEFPTANGPADYALVVDGQLLGVVEAKKVTLGPQNVLTQAERYAKGIDGSSFNFNGYRAPFLYSTNGEVLWTAMRLVTRILYSLCRRIAVLGARSAPERYCDNQPRGSAGISRAEPLGWFQDVRNKLNRSRKTAGFHTTDALREMLSRDIDTGCEWFLRNPNQHSRLRPYQIDANTAIEDAIGERKRQMLVAMATGTGKTFTLVNEVYRLLQSDVGRRILFLVDRRALAAQAVRAFASFEPEPSRKFDKIYEVYSQRFQRDDLDDEKFDPN